MIFILWNFMKCKIFIFFQYFWKEAFKFCGALLLHYVFWVKRKGKIDSNESYYRGLPAFIVPNWGFWISWRRRRMEFLLTQITSRACFFINISIQLFLFCFWKLLFYFKKWEKYDGNIVVLLIFQKLGMKYAFIKIAHPRDCRIHYLYFYEKSYKSRFIV